jgi:Family of unknown function (DUF5985)
MEIVNTVVYLAAFLTSLACMVLLLRGYMHSGTRLLLWSALCFVGLSINNLLLVFDLVIFTTEVDLRAWRLGASLTGLLFLLYGFILESE